MAGELKDIFLESISACHPNRWMKNHLDNLAAQSVTPFTHLFAAGKAGYTMAQAAMGHPVLQNVKGMIVIPYGLETDPIPLDIFRSSHPIPDHNSLKAGKELYRRMASLESSDHFLFLLSGGSSSLVEDPLPPLNLEDIVATYQLLLNSGLPIQQVNRVRTALSAIKGGGLAVTTSASGTVLVMSDVPDDQMEAVGSGLLIPTHRDIPSICCLLEEIDAWNSLPQRVREILQDAHPSVRCPSERGQRIQHRIVLRNGDVLNQLADGCRSRGIHPVLMEEKLAGEARQMGREVAFQALTRAARRPEVPEALIWGGETTVTVRGPGKGGRSQEACLSAILTAVDHSELTFLFAGTDGIDGPTEAAGAIATPPSPSQTDLIQMMEKCLESQDSYNFFDRTGGLLRTGWTGINVMDIAMVLIRPESH